MFQISWDGELLHQYCCAFSHTLSITGRRFNSTYGSDSKLCLYDPKLNVLDSIIVQDQLEDVDSMKNLYASAGNELHLWRLKNNDTEQPCFTEVNI